MTQQRSVAREYLEAILIAVIFLRFTNVFVIQTFYIPSGSMEDTLLIGDHLFVNRFLYGPTAFEWEKRLLPLRDVQRGDIVVFRSKTEAGLDVVKRTIGLPGDRIEVWDKRLVLNGKPVDDTAFALHKDPAVFPNHPLLPSERRYRDNFGPFEVPAAHYFFMGDNRDWSYDSRFWGALPAHMVKGRTLFIYWSNGAQAAEGRYEPMGSKLRNLARSALGFFTHTRWERSFQLIR